MGLGIAGWKAYWGLDPVNGLTTNGGTVHSDTGEGNYWTPVTGSDGVVSGTTFTSAGASFTANMVNHCINVSGNATGRKRIVSVNSGTQLTLSSAGTNGSALAYAIGGPVISMSDLSATMLDGGDDIRIKKSPDVANLGNGTWTNDSDTITLASAVTANIDRCEATGTGDNQWQAATNVTVTANAAARKEGSYCIQVAVAGAFTTGKAAWAQISETDFSSYQQISFWLFPSLAVAANALRIRLCSDTAGDTVVDSYTVPIALVAATWYPISYHKGSALGSSIKSVSLEVLTDLGASSVTLTIDNIFAHNGFCLQSLIGKNSAWQTPSATETYWPIRSINDTTVTLGIVGGTSSQKYYGTSETVTTHYRNPFAPCSGVGSDRYSLLPLGAVTSSFVQQLIEPITVGGSPITVSGGWNPATNTQDGETWYDGLNNLGYGLYGIANMGQYVFDGRIGLARYFVAYATSIQGSTFNDCIAVGCSGGIAVLGTGNIWNRVLSICSGGYGGLIVYGDDCVNGARVLASTTYGMRPGGMTRYSDIYVISNAGTDIVPPAFGGYVYFYNATFNGPTLLAFPLGTGTAPRTQFLIIESFGGVAEDDRCYTGYGWNLSTYFYTKRDAVIYRTAAPSLRLIPANATLRAESAPAFDGVKVPVSSGKTITINVYVRYSKSTDDGGDDFNGTTYPPRIILRRNDKLGITADTVIATHDGSADWFLLTGTTAAAAADGVYEFIVDCTGTAGWINLDDWSFTTS